MRVLFAALLLTASAPAYAACDKAEYKAFVSQAREARRSLVKAPAVALRRFEALDARAMACRSIDKRAPAQYKLLLFHVGLQAYIGAARAERGNLSAGAAMVAAAQSQASAILRAQRDSAQRSLAQALVEQLSVPQDIIDRLRRPK